MKAKAETSSSSHTNRVKFLIFLVGLGSVARIGQTKNANSISIGNLTRPFGRPSRKWEDIIKMETGREALGCIQLVQDTAQWWNLVNT